MSKAISGVGTVIQKWNTGSSDWVAIAEVTNISGPGFTRDLIEVTSLDSTGGWREFIPGFRDGNNVVLSMNYTRASLDEFLADFESDVVQNYEIILPDDTSIEFEGFVQEFPLTIPTDAQITMEVTIKITGEPTINSGQNSSAPA
ncbi:MAG: phage tail tube protein [Novosphingobium sp.]|nr:phage tail tube protein [Novosphingobium sp.]